MGSFKEIVGQKQLKEQMMNSIEQGKISHAYLLYGENRAGKEFVADIFAQALQCEESGVEPCGVCHSCRLAAAHMHPDILYVLHDKPGSIGVDDIRYRINDTVQIKPYQGKYKIYIVPEADLMTPQAQNALLKTIEEPPAYVVIILLTSDKDKMLPTIHSRCVPMDLRPVSDGEMRKYLMETLKVPDYRAEMCIAFARGNVGRAKALASSEDFDKIRHSVLSLLKNVQDMLVVDIVEILDQFSKNEYAFDMNDYLDIMAVWYRDVLLFKATHDVNQLVFREELKSIQKDATIFTYEKIEEIIEALEKAKRRLLSNVKFTLTMELLFFTIKEK